MNSESEDRLIKRVEQLHDKLDSHATETRDRWEGHEKEHRAHDKEHAEIGQWQVKKEEQLRQGSATMAELRTRTEDIEKGAKPPTWPKVAAAVLTTLGTVVLVVLWLTTNFEAKTDKSTTDALQAAATSLAKDKANRVEVDKLNDKTDKLNEKMDTIIRSFTQLSDRLPKEPFHAR